MIVELAYWSGVIALVMACASLPGLLLFRLWRLLRQKLRQRTLQRWRPLLISSLHEPPGVLPPLSRRDRPHVLELWNHLHESLGGDARNSLNRMARAARIPAVASLLLRKKNFHSRLLAARTAGNLRLASAWDCLQEQMASASPMLSLSAALALARIDGVRAIPLMMRQLTTRHDWHPGRVAEILQEAGAKLAAKPLLDAISTAPVGQAGVLILILAEIAPGEAAAQAGRILASTVDDENLLNISLDVLNVPDELEKVRALARNGNWHVRVHAAKALGRLGAMADRALLVEMLGDSQWWVRYRAAQSLTRLPGINATELRHIKDMLTDREARDMLHQAMAELELMEMRGASGHG